MRRSFLAGLVVAALSLLASPCFATTCYITEFSGGAPDGVQVSRTPPVVDQTPVTVSGTSAQSAAFSGDTKIARIVCDGIVSMAFGANPTATTSNMRMAASAPEYFYVLAGQKVAFITNT